MEKEFVVHCPTEELSEKLMKLLDKNKKVWNDGESYLNSSRWEVYRENTCYNIKFGKFADTKFYRERTVIIPAQEYLNNLTLQFSHFLKK